MTKTPQDQAVLGRWTQNYANEKNSIWGAAKKSMGQGIDDIKAITEPGKRGVAFARGAGVLAGVAVAGDALFRGQTADGEDRSALARMGQFLLGSGIAAGSLIVGRGR